MKPKLLLVSRKWPPAVGGMETYSVELAASLDARFEIREFVLPGRKDGHTPSLLGYAGFVLRAMAFCLMRGREFPHFVATDLILFPVAACHWLVAPRHRRLVVVHGLDLVYQSRRGLLPACYRLYFSLFRGVQGIFASVVANSRNTARLARDAGLRNVVVVNPSLPISELTAFNGAPPGLPAAWHAASKRILYFGRLVPRKGALWFAQAVVPHLDETTDFFVVGQSPDSSYRDKLQQCARTHCLGRMDAATLATLIRSADAVVMPNVSTLPVIDVEGFGLAAIETTALGGRLFAAEIDGISDAVSHGVTGLLLPSGNTEEWLKAIRLALASPLSTPERDGIAESTKALYSREMQSKAFVRLLSSDHQRQ